MQIFPDTPSQPSLGLSGLLMACRLSLLLVRRGKSRPDTEERGKGGERDQRKGGRRIPRDHKPSPNSHSRLPFSLADLLLPVPASSQHAIGKSLRACPGIAGRLGRVETHLYCHRGLRCSPLSIRLSCSLSTIFETPTSFHFQGPPFQLSLPIDRHELWVLTVHLSPTGNTSPSVQGLS